MCACAWRELAERWKIDPRWVQLDKKEKDRAVLLLLDQGWKLQRWIIKCAFSLFRIAHFFTREMIWSNKMKVWWYKKSNKIRHNAYFENKSSLWFPPQIELTDRQERFKGAKAFLYLVQVKIWGDRNMGGKMANKLYFHRWPSPPHLCIKEKKLSSNAYTRHLKI